MIYNVRHRTTYTYDTPLSFVRCVLRLTPQTSRNQTVFESTVTISPTPTGSIRRVGPFGEDTQTVVIEIPHEELVVESRSRVEVRSPPLAVMAGGGAWESVRARSFEVTDIGPHSPATFLFPTFRTPIIDEITEYARLSFPERRPIIDAGIDLMTRMRKDFVYDPEATDVSTPIAEAFAAKHGVCQDFTHIMIAGLRGLGLPAAYVSGYLRTIPPPGKKRLEGADATHAWVSMWCGEAFGWIGFDPTNAILAREDHITLAVGRDYGDIAPVDCIMLASGEQSLKVEVDVIPHDEAGVLQPLFAARPA